MTAQKWRKKNFGRNFLHFWMPIIPKTHLIKALNSLVSLRPNGRLSQNPKQEVLGNNFYLKMISKLTLQKFLMPTDAKKMWNWDLEVCQIPWPNWLNKLPKTFWMCHKKIHQEHPQIGKSYAEKIKIYLNGAKRKIL